MNIKIYHLNKTIFLTDAYEDSLVNPNTEFAVYQIEQLDAAELFDLIIKDEHSSIIIVNNNFQALKDVFFSNFKILIAAGGVVENANKEILLIYRRNFWDLPKGKWDDGETIEDCALREIEEETGVRNASIQALLCKTYHTYVQDNVLILKETYWYYITIIDNPMLSPQAEEGIEQVKWVKKVDINAYRNQTFSSILDVLDKYLSIC